MASSKSKPSRANWWAKNSTSPCPEAALADPLDREALAVQGGQEVRVDLVAPADRLQVDLMALAEGRPRVVLMVRLEDLAVKVDLVGHRRDSVPMPAPQTL